MAEYDLDLEDPPCSFHPLLKRDHPGGAAASVVASPTVSPSAFGPEAAGEAAAMACGEKLGRTDVISLVFLLVSNDENALKICRAVEAGDYPEPVGPQFMVSLVQQARRKGLQRWDVKMACALHLICKYRVRRKMLGV